MSEETTPKKPPPPITDRVDRDALLRFLDLQGDLDRIVREYADLGLGSVVYAMEAKAAETKAVLSLPAKKWEPSGSDDA